MIQRCLSYCRRHPRLIVQYSLSMKKVHSLKLHLYLCSVSGGDVRDGPACFFANGLFCAAEEVQQARKGRAVQNHLRTQSIERGVTGCSVKGSLWPLLRLIGHTPFQTANLFQSHLCLDVISSDDVADCSQGRRGHFVVGVPEDEGEEMSDTHRVGGGEEEGWCD